MATEYEFQTTIPVRFRDIDSMGHVNNAVYATYLEQARADYFREVIGESLASVDTVLASLSIDFQRPISPDQTITVGIDGTKLGESSLEMNYEISCENGTIAAVGKTIQVAYDSETKQSRPLPTAWREAIGSL